MRIWRGKVSELILVWLISGSTLIGSTSYLVQNKLLSLSDILHSIIFAIPALITVASHEQKDRFLLKAQETTSVVPSFILIVFVVSLIIFISTTFDLLKKWRGRKKK